MFEFQFLTFSSDVDLRLRRLAIGQQLEVGKVEVSHGDRLLDRGGGGSAGDPPDPVGKMVCKYFL